MKAGWGCFRARFQENIIVHVLEWVFPLGVRFILEQVQWGKVHSRTRFPGGILTILREGLAQHSKGISSISSSTWSQNSSNSLSSQTDFRLQSSSGSSRSTPFSWAVNQVNPPPPRSLHQLWHCIIIIGDFEHAWLIHGENLKFILLHQMM